MGSNCSKCKKLKVDSNGDLSPIKYKHSYDYDLIVIGGGSGGIAAAKEAASANQKVLLCDFVIPSPIGSTWGLGGTCTNVGCVPKKLMHAAGLVGDLMRLAPSYGFSSVKSLMKKSPGGMLRGEFEHNWKQLTKDIQNHIHSLNWKFKVTCNEKKIEYMNVFAKFMDPHTIKTRDKQGETKLVTGNHIVVAIGGRPKYLDIIGGREEDAYCITSDDLFSLSYSPGKVLVIGASYIALECAGFLISLNFEVVVLVRSMILRGFDQNMAKRIQLHLQSLGVLFMIGFEPTKITKLEDGTPPKFELLATNISKEESKSNLSVFKDTFNTILLAIGRHPSTSALNLDAANVKLNKDSGKIIVNDADQTSTKNIYSLGDCAEGRRELAPLAIQSGKLLARRLYRGSPVLTDYTNVPTTVYTPLEYGCIGLSEEDAIEKYQRSNLEIYHTLFQPIEFVLPHILPQTCYLKLICLKTENEQVIGFHYFGPNAGEITQGFALGFRLKATKSDYDGIIGIHPTCAERFTTLYIKKRMNDNFIDFTENC